MSEHGVHVKEVASPNDTQLWLDVFLAADSDHSAARTLCYVFSQWRMSCKDVVSGIRPDQTTLNQLKIIILTVIFDILCNTAMRVP